MLRGSRGEKRPAGVTGAAVKVMRIATGEEKEDERDAAASAAADVGKHGGPPKPRRICKLGHPKAEAISN